ncbi:MAG: adenylate/guanylate cyclase domain-containing protein, partial [Actinomycetota bacterium]
SGRLGILLPDGSSHELRPDDVFDVPPGHDGYVIGHEELVFYEWTGVRAFLEPSGAAANQTLVTVLFTDIVGSSEVATRLGDIRWRELLSRHFESIRAKLARFRGREVKTTGDGILATFTGPGPALRCAAAIRVSARDDGLDIRAGVHVGEAELVEDDVRGVAVHEAERIMSAAGPGEIFVSETTRALASGLDFEDRGVRELKGIAGERRLYAYVAGGPTTSS